jgi:hypothetical protein
MRQEEEGGKDKAVLDGVGAEERENRPMMSLRVVFYSVMLDNTKAIGYARAQDCPLSVTLSLPTQGVEICLTG